MKKYIAPIISALAVALLVAAYAVFWFFVIDEAEISGIIKIGITVAAVLVIGGIAAALFSRIKELKEGQEDDIGKY